MGVSSSRRQYVMMRRRRMKMIRTFGMLLSLIAVLATGILIGRFITSKKSGGAADNQTAHTTTPDIAVDTETEVAVIETETEEKPEVVTLKEGESVFHEEALSDGNFYAIMSPSSIDVSSDSGLGSSYAILINADTKQIVAYKKPYERAVPASMTKVMTVLVAAEQIPASDLENPASITLEISDYCYENDCSVAGLMPEEEVPVKDMFYCTILPSGADGALGLARYISGGQEAFVELMNQKLEELDLSSTAHFANCSGLYNEDHYCTMYDMAVIMATALQNDFAREVLTAHTYTTTHTTANPSGLDLSNLFLRRIEDLEFGGTILGAKTGYVNQSGNCAVSSEISDNGTTYICVTAGAQGAWSCIYDHQYLYQTYATE